MKKRLFITMVLVLIVAISCAALLVGCGKDKKNDAKADDIFKGVDTEDFNAVKEAITNASEELKSITWIYTEYDTNGDSYPIVTKANEKEALVTLDVYNLINYFVLEDDGTTTNYGVKEDGTWVYYNEYYATDRQFFDDIRGDMLIPFEIMTADNVTYDSEDKCFRTVDADETYELKITDKGYRMDVYYEGILSGSYEFIDYNKTTFEKPAGVDGAVALGVDESFPTIF